MQRSNVKKIKKGLIVNIQKFSVHDGPGIRTTVFMQGCLFHCPWCSNPESQDFSPVLMVRDINCKSCGVCVKVCPKGAITITKEAGRKIDRIKCNQCFLCVDSCIYNSLIRSGKYMAVKEVLNEIVQDKLFYKNSGGGVTISGGEPLLQSEFVGKLLEECKNEGLNTALETTGSAPWKKMEGVLRFVNLVLFDIKNLDYDENLKTTGINNSIILENLKKTTKINKIWLRIPLIAGFNDSEGHIKKIALLAKEVDAQKISLLPYHEGGKSKSEQLGRIYRFSEGKVPDDEHINKLKQIIKNEGVEVTIGN